MAKTAEKISFKTTLLRPAASEGGGDWTFLKVPKAASAKLPTRSMTSVDGTLDGKPFQATLSPDGEGSHWLKVERALSKAAGVQAGDVVALVMEPVKVEPEPKVPDDLRKALDGSPKALATWNDVTAVARRDWIHWITSGKKAETRGRRIEVALDKLSKGMRRACCFDRSGMYDKSMSCPVEAPAPKVAKPSKT